MSLNYTSGDIVSMNWRTGRKLGRTIYAMIDKEPSDNDILIGMMDHESIAAIAVLNHNNQLVSHSGVGQF